MHITTLKHNLLLISLFTISVIGQHGLSQPNICSESAVESLYQTYAYPPRDPTIEISGKILFPKHEDPKYVLTFYFSSVLSNTTGNRQQQQTVQRNLEFMCICLFFFCLTPSIPLVVYVLILFYFSLLFSYVSFLSLSLYSFLHTNKSLLRATIFGGQKLPSPFRALIAGGGTGDATIALALGLLNVGLASNAIILHVDLSEASIDIAKKRILKHSDHLRPS